LGQIAHGFAGLFDRFGLGAFDERRVRQAPVERLGFLLCGGQRLFEALKLSMLRSQFQVLNLRTSLQLNYY
jgi:hypothetical protein